MALCDFVIERAIQGYDCSNPMVKGAESMGVLLNRQDIDYNEVASVSPFLLNFAEQIKKCGTVGYRILQPGKTPFNGTQQELVEGTYQNTMTNTLQIVVLRQDADWAKQLFALMNGEFVAILRNKNGSEQVYGYEAGLHCTGAVRELYNDDTLSGWLITMTEEGATKGSLFVDEGTIEACLNIIPCE